MKKLNYLMIVVGVLSFSTIKAQLKVALQSAGTTTIFSGVDPFVDAYNAATDGDTIYISGGGYNAPATIAKNLTIFGAGFHPDSTMATYSTVIISSTLLIGNISSQLHIEGLEVTNIQKRNDALANNVSIVRCKISSINMSYTGAPTVYSTNFVLRECIITGDIVLLSMNSSVVTNCIIENRISNSDNNLIQNNSFLKSASGTNYTNYVIYSSNNNTLNNNIFHTPNQYIIGTGSGNIFSKNVFNNAAPILGSGAVDDNNYKSVTISPLFVNQSGYIFDYAHDYHLQPAAASTHLGNDGSEVGIYGGLFPFKEGAVPQNPHIQTKSIAPQTDTNGDLNIQLKVAAQDH